MSSNYYLCESMAHTEFTCMSFSYHNKRFTRERWCQPCLKRFPIRTNDYSHHEEGRP